MINSSETAFHFFDALPGSLFQRSAHSHSGLDHTFMLIPATPPCLIPDRRRKRRNEPGTLALNVFTLYRMPIPYVTAYFQQSSISGCPDASVAAFWPSCCKRNDASPVVAGGERGARRAAGRSACDEARERPASRQLHFNGVPDWPSDG